MKKPPILINEITVAEMLGVKQATLRQWRLRKMGPPWVTVEGAIRYPVDGLETYIEENTVNPGRLQAVNG